MDGPVGIGVVLAQLPQFPHRPMRGDPLDVYITVALFAGAMIVFLGIVVWARNLYLESRARDENHLELLGTLDDLQEEGELTEAERIKIRQILIKKAKPPESEIVDDPEDGSDSNHDLFTPSRN